MDLGSWLLASDSSTLLNRMFLFIFVLIDMIVLSGIETCCILFMLGIELRVGSEVGSATRTFV